MQFEFEVVDFGHGECVLKSRLILETPWSEEWEI